MDTQRRGSDGRRIFTTAFKQEQISRVTRHELTRSEPTRALALSPSVVRRWPHLRATGSGVAVGADEDVVPARALRAAQQRIKERERALGKKAMEIEILQAVRDEVKKDPATPACPRDDGAQDGADLSRARHPSGVCVSGARRTPL